MKALTISKTLKLPIETVVGTHAILGRKRTGKTYKAKVMAEEMLAAKQQIIVIDPTDAWWGLRSSSDGAGEGYPITIFGGRHGDLPLDPSAAPDLARAVIHDRFSAIFVLKGMSNAAEQRFCALFLETLYTDNQQNVIHTFMDEADIYAPQMPQGEEMRTLGATKKIVRRGGLDGLGITLITQRSADLAKSVLTQCDTLIALGLSHPADLKPVSDWVKVQVKNLALAKEMMEDLPELARGDAWVWSPHHGIREKVTFRDLRTFDSSRTPKPGENYKPPKVLSKVDIDRLGEKIAATIERAKDSDPKLLRAKVNELEKQLAKKLPPVVTTQKSEKSPAPARVDHKQIQRMESLATKVDAGNEKLAKAIAYLDKQRDRLAQAHQAMVSELDNLRREIAEAIKPPVIATVLPIRQNDKPTYPHHVNGQRADVAKPPPIASRAHPVRDDDVLTKMERAMLTCLAQHPDGRTKSQIRLHTGYADSGSVSASFAQLLMSRGSGEGWAEMVGNNLRITGCGRRVLGNYDPLPTGDALYDHLMTGTQLSVMEKKLLAAIRDGYPGSVAKGVARGEYADSGSVSAAFARLVNYGYVLPMGPGQLKLSEELYG